MEIRPERPLEGKIALVTGASRGAGRGIALELGAAGATVYLTGRSTRLGAASTYSRILSLANLDSPPGTIEEAAEAVTAAGGHGIAHPCDHSDPAAVAALVDRIIADAGRIDLLVNNAWGGHESFDGRFDAPFWEHPLSHWDSMMNGGVRLHLLAARAVAPVMMAQGEGLIVATTFWDNGRFMRGNLYYDLAKSAINRLAFGIAEEMRPHGVTSLALSPGWMRTEWVLAGHRASEANWESIPALARTESPRYIGRAVAALAADENVAHHSGKVLRVADLAEIYHFTDVDGRRVPAFELQ